MHSQHQEATLLTLPLEIRRMIFKLLIDNDQPVLSERKPEPDVENMRIIAMVDLRNPLKAGRRFRCFQPTYRIDPIISIIRAVNRQLYRETLDFFSFPKFRVRVTIDQNLDAVRLAEVMKVLKYSFVRENTREVCFQFEGDRLFKRDWALFKEGYKRWFDSLVFWSWRGIKESFGVVTHERPIADSPFKQMVGLLPTYSHLECVDVKTYRQDLFQVWRHPERDMPAFAPLLERGVQVDIEVGTPNAGLWFFSRKKLVRELTEGDGDVFLEPQDMKPWVGAPLGAQLFSAKLSGKV